MVASNTKIGSGLVLTWNSQTVARIEKIGEFGFEVDKIPATVFSSASYFKEYIAGLVDSGDISFEGNLGVDDTNGQVAMFTDAKARTSRTFLITGPTTLGTVTFTGTGFLSKCKIGDATPEGIMKIKGSITPTGATTMTLSA